MEKYGSLKYKKIAIFSYLLGKAYPKHYKIKPFFILNLVEKYLKHPVFTLFGGYYATGDEQLSPVALFNMSVVLTFKNPET